MKYIDLSVFETDICLATTLMPISNYHFKMIGKQVYK